MASTDVTTLPFAPTPEISTGDVATVNDAYDATKQMNGAKLTLGTAIYVRDTSNRIKKYRYVQLTGTVKPALIVGPVYWTDDTKTIVSPTLAEGKTATQASVAGVLVNSAATYSNYVFILVKGFLAAMPIVALTAAGDAIIGAAGNQQTVKASAVGQVVFAIALTAVAGGKSDIDVCLEQ